MSGSGLRRRLPVALAAVTAASLVAVLPAAASSGADHRGAKHGSRLAAVQLLTFNDFHGS